MSYTMAIAGTPNNMTLTTREHYKENVTQHASRKHYL